LDFKGQKKFCMDKKNEGGSLNKRKMRGTCELVTKNSVIGRLFTF
jgi:hypothetical protein